jgi:hypothetical protein
MLRNNLFVISFYAKLSRLLQRISNIYAMKFKMDKDYCFANFCLIFELPKYAIVLCICNKMSEGSHIVIHLQCGIFVVLLYECLKQCHINWKKHK